MKKKHLFIIITIIILFISIITYILLTNNTNANKKNKNTDIIVNEKQISDDVTEEIRIVPANSKEESKSESKKETKDNMEAETKKEYKKQEKSSEKSTTANTTVPNSNISQKKYKCPSDYTLEGTICYKYVKPRIEYECPFGATKTGAYCIINTSTNANVSYYCENDFNLSGDKCYKKKVINSYNPNNYANYSETSKTQIYNTFQNNCSNGTISYEGGIYYCYMTEVTYASASYSCPQGSGDLAGDKCISARTEEAFAKYYCDNGNLDITKKMCVISKKAEEK